MIDFPLAKDAAAEVDPTKCAVRKFAVGTALSQESAVSKIVQFLIFKADSLTWRGQVYQNGIQNFKSDPEPTKFD